MEESMHKRLEAIRIRYEELEKELTSEEVATDVAKFTRLSKEKSDMEEAYEKYSEYLRLSQEIKDSLEMEESGDAELAELPKKRARQMKRKKKKLNRNSKAFCCPKILTMTKTSSLKFAEQSAGMRRTFSRAI